MTFGEFFAWVLLIMVIASGAAAAIFYEKHVRSRLADQGFNPSYIFLNGIFKTGIAVDEANEGIAILWPGIREPTLLDFTEVVAAEVRRNDQVTERTNRKRQIVGGVAGKLVAGNVGWESLPRDATSKKSPNCLLWSTHLTWRHLRPRSYSFEARKAFRRVWRLFSSANSTTGMVACWASSRSPTGMLRDQVSD